MKSNVDSGSPRDLFPAPGIFMKAENICKKMCENIYEYTNVLPAPVQTFDPRWEK